MKDLNYQQYYPTYEFKERDIVLSEFEEAQKIANKQSEIFGQLANLLVAFVTIWITIFIKITDGSNKETIDIFTNNIIILYVFIFVVAFFILRYFIELRRTIVINCRKVITLRKMLGLDYGNLQLTLPNWRVEGATNPFVIKLFPGWFSFGSSPFWIIVLALNIIWYLTYKQLNNYFINNYWFLVNITFSLLFSFTYRTQLKELHETFFLLIVKLISKFFRIKLVKNFEYVLYRLKLSVCENERLKYDVEKVKEMLIEIEDIRFYKHYGIDIKSLIRSFLSIFKFYRNRKGILKNGGSTITMQLCRTLFIPANQNVFFRKVTEIILTFWIESQFSKDVILDFYLVSVRFEKKINGIVAAKKYFFPELERHCFSYEEAFFLVERLSNVTSSYRLERIYSILERITIKDKIDKNELINLYDKMEKNGKIIRKF